MQRRSKRMPDGGLVNFWRGVMAAKKKAAKPKPRITSRLPLAYLIGAIALIAIAILVAVMLNQHRAQPIAMLDGGDHLSLRMDTRLPQ